MNKRKTKQMTDEAKTDIAYLRQKLRADGLTGEKIEDALTVLGSINVGTKPHSAHLEDLAWIAERPLYMQDGRSVTLKVKRGEDEHILVEVIGLEE